MNNEEIIRRFREHKVRVTVQRIAVYRTVLSTHHPDAETILRILKKDFPSLTAATVYNNLEALEKAGLIRKVLTDKGKMRYDGILEEHHHLLDTEEDVIIDYFDEELTRMLMDHIRKKPIEGFEVDRIMVQLFGKKKKDTGGERS